MTTANCQACVHNKNSSKQDIYCMLHDQTYTSNQEDCADFEEKEDIESVAFECD